MANAMRSKGLLLDRDGVINLDQGYVGRREDFAFMPGLFPFLRKMQDEGYKLAIVTNQSGVARGYYSVDDFNQLTTWMLAELAKESIHIDAVLASFEHAEGSVPELRRGSYWRKPNPGMMLEAALRLNLDLEQSIMIGNEQKDAEAARAAVVGKIFLLAEEENMTANAGITHKSFADILKVLGL